MNVAEVEKRVQHIRDLWDENVDAHAAHNEEDTLRADVLRAIAAGAEDAPALAAAVLATDNIQFTRWYS